jgi:hypothetical protein
VPQKRSEEKEEEEGIDREGKIKPAGLPVCVFPIFFFLVVDHLMKEIVPQVLIFDLVFPEAVPLSYHYSTYLHTARHSSDYPSHAAPLVIEPIRPSVCVCGCCIYREGDASPLDSPLADY